MKKGSVHSRGVPTGETPGAARCRLSRFFAEASAPTGFYYMSKQYSLPADGSANRIIKENYLWKTWSIYF